MMIAMRIDQLAAIINADAEACRWFWVYGILKETQALWQGDNRNLLCADAQIVLDSVSKAKGEHECQS